MTLLSESQLDVVISVSAFTAVFVVVMLFVRLRIKLNKEKRKVDVNKSQDYVIESVLSKHLAKLDRIVTSIGELKARLDLLEGHNRFDTPSSPLTYNIPSITNTHAEPSRTVYGDKVSDITSQNLANDKSHKYTISNSVSSDFHPDIKHSIRQGTSIYILKLLQGAPKNAREIQYNVGKTREHISRLMKKLHDEGLVDRNMDAKPFIYKITDEGRKLLE